MTEKEKMLAGKIYDPSDKELLGLRAAAHKLSAEYNATFETQEEERAAIMKKLVPNAAKGVYLQGPVQFDYGCFTEIGKTHTTTSISRFWTVRR